MKESKDNCLLIAFLYYSFKGDNDNSQLIAFKNWVVSNQIFNIRIVDSKNVIDIFNKLLEQDIRIFMAMPYYGDNEVDDYNDVLKRVVDKIVLSNNHLNLKMYPIMREQGASMDIVHNLLNNIKNCEIFIADITGNNQNVFFEYGYAHSLNKKIVLLKKTDDDAKVPFDIEHNLRLKYKGMKNLEILLEERIKQSIVQLGYILN